MMLRPATLADAQALWEWRNDVETRNNSFDGDVVDWDGHRAWLEQKLASADSRIWILEAEGSGVGQIRYDRIGDAAHISFSVAPRFRRRGFSTHLLRLSGVFACRELQVAALVGVVKDHNTASQKSFERAGFRREGPFPNSGHACWRFVFECPETNSR